LLNPAGQKDAYGDMVQEFSRYMVYLEQHSTDAPGKLSPEAQQAIKDFRRAAAAELAQTTPAPTGAAANYKIYSIPDGRIMDTFYAANQAAAEDQFRDWLMSPQAGASDNFRYAPMGTIIRGERSADAASNGIIDIEPDVEQYLPGSTLDLQRQRQQAAQQSAAAGTFRGTWAIKDNQGNTLHTFSGIGNSQADANRVAAGWLAQQGYQAGLEVEVVPVMEPQ
jgi:hypothetical protein